MSLATDWTARNGPDIEPKEPGSRVFFAPPTSNGIVWLRPIRPEDYTFLRSLEMSGEIGVRWRFRGSTPSPEQWIQSLWGNSLAQFIAMSASDNQAIAMVSLYDANFQDGIASVAVSKFSIEDRSMRTMSALLLFLNYSFTNWPLRKVYFDVPEFNLEQFGMALKSELKVEAQLKDHMFAAGRYWDRFTLSLFREHWDEVKARYATLIDGTS
ncbi:MAG TPA: GNAT family protein [Solirubrobacterales bacterium]|nr:GNAT family protein [Solirubrobacterales bacterium]